MLCNLLISTVIFNKISKQVVFITYILAHMLQGLPYKQAATLINGSRTQSLGKLEAFSGIHYSGNIIGLHALMTNKCCRVRLSTVHTNVNSLCSSCWTVLCYCSHTVVKG